MTREELIKATAVELSSCASEESRKAQHVTTYWTALATRAVDRILQVLKDKKHELSSTTEAFAGHTRLPIDAVLSASPEQKLQPRPARRRNAKKRRAPAAKHSPSRRKRSR